MFSFALSPQQKKCMKSVSLVVSLGSTCVKGVIEVSPHYHQQLPTLPTEIVMTGDGGGDDGTMGFGSFVLETAAEPIMVVMLV